MTNSEKTRKFFTLTDLKTKNQIIGAVALHYGITEAEAFEELIDPDAESLLDYLTGATRTAAHVLYQRHGLA